MTMFQKTTLDDLLIYTPKVFGDHRGFFMESFNARHFHEAGIVSPFVQDNRSFSSRGTLRGLHMQTGPAAQAKLVTVTRGHVYDVAVDLRPESKTFKQWIGVELKDSEPRSLYIPRGFAHGFVVLSETAEFFYKVDNYYSPTDEAGIIFDDPLLNIDWKIAKKDLILSDKDKSLPTLSAYLKTVMEK
ncbi:MAG: dTDP-4-dehydrorhamnose 3,5-epimerase [Bdellovibrionaceae bacterium]|nr:dTDP-4-dehydrorhamnose 3,5-epimerase [Pseudobdellovibrionaceae bacterium]